MKPPRILISSLRPGRLRRLGIWLVREGYRVATIPVGEGGTGAQTPDLLFLDLEPSPTDSLRQLRHLKACPRDRAIPVILISSSPTPTGELKAGLKAGAADFIRLPLDRAETLFRVKNVLSTQRETNRFTRRVAKLRKLSSIDPLTGLCNRREAEKVLGREVKHALACHQPLGFIVGDLDHFKEINDSYGHKAGDYVLKETARLFAGNIRSSDCLARPSGDEFWLIAPGTSGGGAHKLCEKLRILIAGLSLSKLKPNPQITISWGASELRAGCPDNVDRLIEEADHALYRSKHRGRNRTSVFHGLI